MSQSLIPAWQQSSGSSVASIRSSRSLERSVSSELQQLGARHVIDLARTRAAEDREIEKIHAIEGITDAGVMSAAMVMNRARMLMDMNPMDAGVIQSIAQIGCFAIADRVRSSGRRLD